MSATHPSAHSPRVGAPAVGRRTFLKRAAAAPAGLALPRAAHGRTRDIVVVGAGAFGGWTAYYLARMGATVTLVDVYGPGNSRSTSGDETRGVRSSYGDRGPWAALWVRWASEAIDRWKTFDADWGRQMRVQLWFNTSDLIFRAAADPFTDRTRELWTALRIPFETPAVADVAREYPVFDLRGMSAVLREPGAGVVRARRACEVVAEAFRQAGGEIRLGYASLGDRVGARLQNIRTAGPAATFTAGTYVFALGPWFPSAFPDVMRDRIRTPLGYVHYFGTPPGDDRYTFPNLPSYNFPGCTGWPALPVDNRGFRVRLRGAPLTDPDTSERVFDRDGNGAARDFLAQRIPRLAGAPILETRACHYELSSTRNFIIDRHPQFENVWLAGGGSAEGFKFGPMVGDYVARRVLGQPTDPMLAEAFRL